MGSSEPKPKRTRKVKESKPAKIVKEPKPIQSVILELRTDEKGKYVFGNQGSTFVLRDTFKQMKCSWDKDAKVWRPRVKKESDIESFETQLAALKKEFQQHKEEKQNQKLKEKEDKLLLEQKAKDDFTALMQNEETQKIINHLLEQWKPVKQEGDKLCFGHATYGGSDIPKMTKDKSQLVAMFKQEDTESIKQYLDGVTSICLPYFIIPFAPKPKDNDCIMNHTDRLFDSFVCE